MSNKIEYKMVRLDAELHSILSESAPPGMTISNNLREQLGLKVLEAGCHSRRKYDLRGLAVGERVRLEWRERDGQRLGVSQSPLYTAIRRHMTRTGEVLETSPKPFYLEVLRVK